MDENGKLATRATLHSIAGGRETVEVHTPLQLIAAIRDGRIDVSRVTAQQRRGAVAELLRQGVRCIEIAEMFGVSRPQISKDKKRITRDMGQLVDDFDAKGFLGYLIEEAEWHIAVAKRAKDFRLSWQVIMSLQLMLREYGVLKPPRPQIDLDENVDPLEKQLDTLTYDELQKIEGILSKEAVAVNE